MTGDGDAASGCGRGFGTRRGRDPDLHGEGAGPIGLDDNAGRCAGSGDAADCDERGTGGDYDSVKKFSVAGSQFSEKNSGQDRCAEKRHLN